MNYLRNHLAFIVIVALAIIVLAFSALILIYGVPSHKGVAPVPAEETNLSKKNVETNTIPDQFPTDVPIEEAAKITQNYNATTADGRFQATRAFETSLSLDTNFKIYQDYLKNNGWKTEATVNQPNYKMLLGSKGFSQLQISLNENTVSKVKTVDISLTQTGDSTPVKK